MHCFREILAEYKFDLKYFKGSDIPTDFHSRHVLDARKRELEVKISSLELLGQLNKSLFEEKMNQGRLAKKVPLSSSVRQSAKGQSTKNEGAANNNFPALGF